MKLLSLVFGTIFAIILIAIFISFPIGYHYTNYLEGIRIALETVAGTFPEEIQQWRTELYIYGLALKGIAWLFIPIVLGVIVTLWIKWRRAETMLIGEFLRRRDSGILAEAGAKLFNALRNDGNKLEKMEIVQILEDAIKKAHDEVTDILKRKYPEIDKLIEKTKIGEG